jgi:hypothetical protein
MEKGEEKLNCFAARKAQSARSLASFASGKIRRTSCPDDIIHRAAFVLRYQLSIHREEK